MGGVEDQERERTVEEGCGEGSKEGEDGWGIK